MFIKNKSNNEKRKLDFLNKVFLKKLDSEYEYDLIDYTNNRKKIRIKCKKHDLYFEQRPSDHLKGIKSCPECISNKKLSSETFILKSILVHGSKFIYDKVNYVNSKKEVIIICPEHGEFYQKPYLHLQGHGCDYCRKSYFKNFLEKSKKLHNNKYDYSLVNYINNNKKIKIICPEHGEFEQTPMQHLRGFGCKKCSQSRGETIISDILRNKNIVFIYQKTFEKCKNKKLLPFDFFLPEHNICIEYDGRHHYDEIDKWGGKEKLIYTSNNDRIKEKFCYKSGLKLIRIHFKLNNTEILNLISSNL